MDSRRAWVTWSIGVAAYIVAVLQRTSFGVAGVAAAERFGAPASVLSLFVVVQLLTYALMQVPAGVLVDRFGSKLLVGAGVLLMAVGQVDLAFSREVASAVVARILVGAGDAMVFGSVLRLLPNWFSPRRIPFLTQVTGLTGQGGQLLSAIPLAAVLNAAGWETAFASASALGAVVGMVVLAALRNSPSGPDEVVDPPRRESVWTQVRAVVAQPGTQLGFWAHWVSGFPGLVFAMMWGYPFLHQGQGQSHAATGTLFLLFVVSSVVVGPTLGVLTQRHPLRRSNLVMGVVLATATPWAAVVLWPGPAPWWLLAVLALALGAAGPGSAVGFDFARTSNAQHRVGTATGVVIMGAFLGGLAAILSIGMVLDVVDGDRLTLRAFRWAMATQFVWYAIGFVAMVEARGRTRRRLADEHGVVVPTWREALAREWRRVHGRGVFRPLVRRRGPGR